MAREMHETWVWRNMLYIKWSHKINYQRVLQQAKEKKKPSKSNIKERKKLWVEHVLRRGNHRKKNTRDTNKIEHQQDGARLG